MDSYQSEISRLVDKADAMKDDMQAKLYEWKANLDSFEAIIDALLDLQEGK